jgi:hypothetical protein
MGRAFDKLRFRHGTAAIVGEFIVSHELLSHVRKRSMTR